MMLKLFNWAQVFLQRHPWLLPLLSFGFGWASFVLVQRGEHLARAIAGLAVIGWPWLLAEELLGSWLVKRTGGRLSTGLLHFITQSLQLEMLFFALPFLIGATHGDPGQIVFTGLAAVATLICTLDPVYARRVAGDNLVHVVFHAFCSFLTGLVLLPIVFTLPLEAALPLAWTLTGVMLLASLPRLLAGSHSIWMRLLRLGAMTGLLLGLWAARAHIPPAGLWVPQSLITQTISDDLVPGDELTQVPAQQLDQGLVAFVAVRAPHGLSQSVTFEWRHQGVLQDRISAEIRGGREQGFRLYSRKRNFPAEPSGAWTVDLLTPQGQRISRLQFRVS